MLCWICEFVCLATSIKEVVPLHQPASEQLGLERLDTILLLRWQLVWSLLLRGTRLRLRSFCFGLSSNFKLERWLLLILSWGWWLFLLGWHKMAAFVTDWLVWFLKSTCFFLSIQSWALAARKPLLFRWQELLRFLLWERLIESLVNFEPGNHPLNYPIRLKLWVWLTHNPLWRTIDSNVFEEFAILLGVFETILVNLEQSGWCSYLC